MKAVTAIGTSRRGPVGPLGFPCVGFCVLAAAVLDGGACGQKDCGQLGEGDVLVQAVEVADLVGGRSSGGLGELDRFLDAQAGAGYQNKVLDELPPLAWVRPVCPRPSGEGLGTTPAGAGTTRASGRPPPGSRNYPRWRGDDGTCMCPHTPRNELPPLARGRHLRRSLPRLRSRTTPAGAGTTSPFSVR